MANPKPLTPQTVAPKDPWQSDRVTWEHISIPEENALGQPHAKLSIGRHEFEPGKTYLVPPEVAGTLKERLRIYARSVVRVLQPKRDTEAERLVAVGTSGGGTPTDPSTF